LNGSRDAAYLALIQSDRVSAETREALLARAEPDEIAYTPQMFNAGAFATLRAVRVLPQDRVDVAQRLDRALAEGSGDGWHFAALAPDGEAYRSALEALAGFAGLDPATQDAMLANVQKGEHGAASALVQWRMPPLGRQSPHPVR